LIAAKRYYFYLAFENADCVDYITEKFWSALLAGMQIPGWELYKEPVLIVGAHKKQGFNPLGYQPSLGPLNYP